jgi:hypothetical protein
MEALLLAPWRTVPAVLLVAAGLVIFLRGIRALGAARTDARDPERALLVARAFRVWIMGLCLLVLGGAWLAGVGWLAVIALIVLGEEMLETSVMVAALRDGARRDAATRTV